LLSAAQSGEDGKGLKLEKTGQCFQVWAPYTTDIPEILLLDDVVLLYKECYCLEQQNYRDSALFKVTKNSQKETLDKQV